MDIKEILATYIPLVEFISTILGDNCEVVLHDVTCPNNSIIAIKNGELSGRCIGGPITDLVLKTIQNKGYKNQSFVANYKAEGNHKTFRSSSYFIRDAKDEIIGALCVNIDIGPYTEVKNLMDKLSFISHNFSKDIAEESFYDNVDELLHTMIGEVITDVKVSVERMSIEEKIYVVQQLHNKGAFQLKGAVSEVAQTLLVSEPTIYRYLNKYKEKEN